MAQNRASAFRQRLMARETLLGTFVQTPATHPVEILGSLGFDFLVIDGEHGPFDRVAMDAAILAARAMDVPCLARVPEANAAQLLAVLDDGATGVVVPHVASAAIAREVAEACRYKPGRRGFSNSTRAGGYGARAMWDHVEVSDREVVVAAIIEDPEALDEIDAIAGVDGIDVLLIGRGDLTMALRAASPDAPEIQAATRPIAMAAKAAGKIAWLNVGSVDEARAMSASLGITCFSTGSDQAFLREAASSSLAAFRAVRS
ncbi:HpcH/HpaI aldolase family protein [Rhodoligotrophos ferricapiens]|uniref:HpcH/HpaI aldolase family protein n=1 Tax=Rhodoligotrophos ferricapiens TaxID=3069264 RepID=UPI00315D7609